MTRRTLGWGAIALAMCSVPAWAGTGPAGGPSAHSTAAPAARQQNPAIRVGWLPVEKLGRGLANVATGWLEVPATIEQRYHEDDPAATMISGAFIGVFKAIGRTAVGAFETVTFLLPIPPDYGPILPPLYAYRKERWSLTPSSR